MGEFLFTIGGKDYKVKVKSIDENIAEIELDGKTFKVNIREMGVQTPMKKEKKPSDGEVKTEPKKISGSRIVEAPLPGVILNIMVREGDEVKEGQDILIMEAMKMENSIQSPFSGIVKKIYAKKDDTVQEGEKLLEIGN